jgi:hypothetical protein
MNPELIHDALNLLPADLLHQTDLLRKKSKRRSVRFLPIVSAAACFVMVVGAFMLLQPGIQKNAPSEAAAQEVPAMMQAAPLAPETLYDETPAMEETAKEMAEAPVDTAPDTDSVRNNSNSTAAGTQLAAPVTVRMAGTAYTLSREDSAVLNAMLTALDYNQQAETDIPAGITAESEAIGHITLNLAKGYARKDDLQTALTAEQIEIIWNILERAS